MNLKHSHQLQRTAAALSPAHLQTAPTYTEPTIK